MDRLLQSRWLRESAQLCALLRHIVEETLAGRPDGLKEYMLGREVFHRPGTYDPRNDAIVRVQASLLRKRLDFYYQHEGLNSSLRIELPRGGYVPSFRDVSPPEPCPELLPPEHTADTTEAPSRTHKKTFAAGVAAGLVVAVIGAWIYQSASEPKPAEAPALWASFLDPATETIASFGIPLFYSGGSGLYIRDVQVNSPGDETKGQVLAAGKALGVQFRPQEDVYTGVGDVMGAHSISRWLEIRGIRTRMANSHFLGHSDIAGKNLVVASSIRFQTLVQELRLPSRFKFDGSMSGAFLVDRPVAGEPERFEAMSGTGVDTSYALMSLWPGNRQKNRILYITGITTWATQGGAQFAIDPEKLRELQRRLDSDPPNGPRGRKSPFFQTLIRVEGKQNQVRSVNYVTHRYLPEQIRLNSR